MIYLTQAEQDFIARAIEYYEASGSFKKNDRALKTRIYRKMVEQKAKVRRMNRKAREK